MAKQKQQPVTVMPDLGKVPPQSIDMEELVLGSIMNDPESILNVVDILKPESFYKEAHQKIFRVALSLAKQNKPVDMFTVSEQLRAQGDLDSVGGPIYLMTLAQKIVSTANIEYYAKIVVQKYVQRQLIYVALQLQNKAFDDSIDIAELLEYAEMNFLEISVSIYRKKASKLSDITFRVVDQVRKIQTGEIKLVGVPSGFTSLDRTTAGFKKKELTLIAARPSMGKTAVAIQIAQNAATYKYPVAIFSCEMSEDELGRRVLSGESGYTNIQLLNGKCDFDELCKAAERTTDVSVYIDDTSAISVIELRAKVRRMIIELKINLVIVDYLQLMRGEGDSREQEVSYISRGLKAIAKDLDIPVIALSQLNRDVEKRADKKPMLADLRESGSLEQDSDVVMFVYRPEKYGFDTYEIDGTSLDTKNLMMLLVAKNRNGAVGEIKLRANNQSLSRIFDDYDFKYNNTNTTDPNKTFEPNKSFDEPGF